MYEFRKASDAVYCLYEQLYDSLGDINKEAIYSAIYLLMQEHGCSADLLNFSENVTPNQICVIHKGAAKKIIDDAFYDASRSLNKTFYESLESFKNFE